MKCTFYLSKFPNTLSYHDISLPNLHGEVRNECRLRQLYMEGQFPRDTVVIEHDTRDSCDGIATHDLTVHIKLAVLDSSRSHRDYGCKQYQQRLHCIYTTIYVCAQLAVYRAHAHSTGIYGTAAFLRKCRAGITHVRNVGGCSCLLYFRYRYVFLFNL